MALPMSIFPNGVLKTTAGCDGHELWKANPSVEARNGLRETPRWAGTAAVPVSDVVDT